MTTDPMAGATEWWLVGGLIVFGFGALGYFGEQPDSIGVGMVAASIAGGLTLAGWWGWRQEESTHPVPAAEYHAAVWAAAYILLLALTATRRDYQLADALIIFPPVSLLPFVVRMLLGDDGNPRGRARSVARHLHQVCGIVLTALGCLLVVSLFFIVLAPLPLIPGLLNLRAASRYRIAAQGSDGGRATFEVGRSAVSDADG